MKLKTSIFISFAGMFLCLVLSGQPSASVGDYSALLSGSKTVEMFDSLSNTMFFHSSLFKEDMSIKNKYAYSADFIPEYSDSLVRSRIADMNASSPIEFRYTEDVMAHIDFYLKRRSFLARILGLTELYFPMFEEMLDKYNLPLELKYVTIIESALNPLAKSKAGASGLWQFMLKTGQIYGLESNSYIEDRFDPYKATDAACRHFIDLYNIYGDWALCLAAYNAGAGRINRAIKVSNNRNDYWLIRQNLPRETQKYVPAFIAAAYVFTYYAEHNIRPMAPVIIDTQIDTVSVKAELSFFVISKMLEIPMEVVELLNPSYKKQLIPASTTYSYKLRIPKSKLLRFTELELDMYYYTYATKYPELLTDYVTYSGQTIYQGPYITERSILLNQNDTTRVDTLKLLKTISSSDELLSLVRYYDSSGKSAKPATTSVTSNTTKATSSTSVKSPNGTHTVQKGESLGLIARNYGCTVEQLMQWNNKSNQTIHPGQILKVNGQTSSGTSNTSQASANDQITWYTVKHGDSLWGIANKYSTTVEKIKTDNKISGNNISVGQKIKIIK